MDTDVVLDELVAPDKYPYCQNSRQQHCQSTQKVASKASRHKYILNTTSFTVINSSIFVLLNGLTEPYSIENTVT
jgi:hypothetical protein